MRSAPSLENAATGSSPSANRRRTRSRERKIGPCGLGRHHQDGGRPVGQRDTRAGAEQHAPWPGTEAAQTFEARGAGMRQGCRQPGDLGGGGVATVEPARRQRRRALALEDRCRGRIGPQNRGSRRGSIPKPGCAERMRREARIAQPGEPGTNVMHRRSHPNQDAAIHNAAHPNGFLIGPASRGVHASSMSGRRGSAG